MKVFKRALFALGFLLAISQQAQAGLVTWGLNVNLAGGATVTGTVSFNNVSLVCTEIGCSDPADTDTLGNFVLTSSAFGWANQEFNINFLPFFNPVSNDGPHVNDAFEWDSHHLQLINDGVAILDWDENNPPGTWSFVPAPASILLMGIGLAALRATRRKPVQAQLAAC